MRVSLEIPMSLSEIANACGGFLKTNANPLIHHVTTDTRELTRGDLFIALKGEKYNGSAFISEAKRREAYTLSDGTEGTDIFHHNSQEALLSFGENYIKSLPFILYKIGITGSVGKTTTKEFLNVILSKKYKCHASSGNHNNQIGMPMSILSAPADSQAIVMEIGMSNLGEIRKLANCLRPDIAVITNVGTAHIGNLGSRENIAKAKLEITESESNRVTIVPYEEPLLYEAKRRVTFSILDTRADYFLKCEGEDILLYKNGDLFCRSHFIPKEAHNRFCLAAAVAVAVEAGLCADELGEGISSISNDITRQNIFSKGNYIFYADFYNASLESVTAFIYEAEKYESKSKKSLLLGDVLELGEMSKDIHFEIGSLISEAVFSNLFLIGQESFYIAKGAIKNGFPSDRIFLNPCPDDPRTSAEQIRTYCEAGEVIFMKASRGIKLERVLDCFTDRREDKY